MVDDARTVALEQAATLRALAELLEQEAPPLPAPLVEELVRALEARDVEADPPALPRAEGTPAAPDWPTLSALAAELEQLDDAGTLGEAEFRRILDAAEAAAGPSGGEQIEPFLLFARPGWLASRRVR